MSERLFDLHYVLSGSALDLDTLLRDARPSLPFTSWRQGEQGGRGPHKTSGLHLDIAERIRKPLLTGLVLDFLKADVAFLEAARRQVGGDTRHAIEVIVPVYGWGETSFAWPPALLAALAAADLGITVEAWPISEDESDGSAEPEVQAAQRQDAADKRRA